MTTNAGIALADLRLTKEESRTILERAAIRMFPQGALVVQNGNRSEYLYIIIEGQVKTFITDSNGNETVISCQGPGEYFGGMGFDEGPPLASIMTVEPSRLLELAKSEFKAFLPKHHLFAARVFEKLVREVEEHARELSEAMQQKEAISDILRAISNSATNVHVLLESLAENAARLCDVTDAEIMQLEGDELRLVAKHGPSQLWQLGLKFLAVLKNYGYAESSSNPFITTPGTKDTKHKCQNVQPILRNLRVLRGEPTCDRV